MPLGCQERWGQLPAWEERYWVGIKMQPPLFENKGGMALCRLETIAPESYISLSFISKY